MDSRVDKGVALLTVSVSLGSSGDCRVDKGIALLTVSVSLE